MSTFFQLQMIKQHATGIYQRPHACQFCLAMATTFAALRAAPARRCCGPLAPMITWCACGTCALIAAVAAVLWYGVLTTVRRWSRCCCCRAVGCCCQRAVTLSRCAAAVQCCTATHELILFGAHRCGMCLALVVRCTASRSTRRLSHASPWTARGQEYSGACNSCAFDFF